MRGVDGNFNISFSGNSITVGNEWGGVFGDLRILNRGISGDISAGVIKRVSEITARKPGEFF